MSVIEIVEVDDHERFRAELASIRPDGKRRWVFARKPHGKFTQLRTVVAVVLIAFLVVAPFVKIGGHQFVLLNIIDREFVFFGVPFWPNDFYIVAVLFLTGVITVVVFTATLGRFWCGWLCPQTIFMETVFRRIEWLIEGGPKEQARRRTGPWNWDRLWRTTLKIQVFFIVSFFIANIFLAYIVSSDELLKYVSHSPLEHLKLFGGLLFFTFVFFMVFYRFREQACLIACPYGRYMSALVDDNTIAVTYDFARGEQRAKWTRYDSEQRTSAISTDAPPSRSGIAGHCVDCHQCVTVCPTGIDIRNGIQLECVNCTACIDACDHVMEKVGLPTGLIRYSSQKAIETGVAKVFTRRIRAYIVVWLLMVGVAATLFAFRSELDVVILRQEGTTWVQTQDGLVNFYRLQIINKSSSDLSYRLTVVSPSGYSLRQIGMPTTVSQGQILKGRFMIIRDSTVVGRTDDKVSVSLTSNTNEVRTVVTSFVGP